jgi:hypothetical protein
MSRLQFKRTLLAVFLVLGMVGGASRAASEENARDVLEGVIQRAAAIHSGKVEYQFEAGSVGANSARPMQGPRTAIIFDDQSVWRDSDARHAELRCDGLVVRFDATQQRDGSVRNIATVERAAPSQSPGSENRIPVFAGTFWTAAQLEFVKQHREKVRRTGSANITGVKCDVISLSIGRADVANVVQFALPSLTHGAELRMSVAPELGFAMPLVEIVATDGTPTITYSSSEFVQLSQGSWFPKKTRMEMQLPNGDRYFEQFLTTPLAFNDSGLLEQLVLRLPAGTTVLDNRNAGGRLELESATTSFDLLGIPSALARSRAAWGLNSMLIVAAILGIAGLLAVWLIFARRGKRLGRTDL